MIAFSNEHTVAGRVISAPADRDVSSLVPNATRSGKQANQQKQPD
jgi:hypothetical protein